MTMNFEMVGAAFAAFVFLFFVQISIAAVFRPVSEDKFIILLFTILPFLVFLVALGFQFFNLCSVDQGVAGYLLFFVISSSWVASYPAVYAVCPTLIISYVIYRSPRDGVSLQELRDLLQLKQNSDDRILDAVHDKWITKSGDVVMLTSFGRTVLWCFRTYRRLLGARLETL